MNHVHEFLEVVEAIKVHLNSEEYRLLCDAAKLGYQFADPDTRVELFIRNDRGELAPVSSRHRRLVQRRHFSALRDVIKDYKAIRGASSPEPSHPTSLTQ
jgi:hypothetical protein